MKQCSCWILFIESPNIKASSYSFSPRPHGARVSRWIMLCAVWLTLCNPISWSTIYTITHEVCNASCTWIFHHSLCSHSCTSIYGQGIKWRAIENASPNIIKSLLRFKNQGRIRQKSTWICFLNVYTIDLWMAITTKCIKDRRQSWYI